MRIGKKYGMEIIWNCFRVASKRFIGSVLYTYICILYIHSRIYVQCTRIIIIVWLRSLVVCSERYRVAANNGQWK